MASYILRAFDKELAKTGFRCIMLTGSYYVGSVVEDTSPGVVGISGATFVGWNEVCQLTINGITYSFDSSSGKCNTPNYEEYRVMLADTASNTSIEEVLTNIYNALAAINTTIGQYCSEVDRRLTGLSDEIQQVAASIPDVSDFVTQEEYDALEERVRALEEEQPENNK